MELKQRIETFEKELGLFKSGSFYDFTTGMLALVPDYFFQVPASSTGKYHPTYTLGEGGLVRHVKAAVAIAVDLFEMYPAFKPEEKSIALSSLILHDCCKCGRKLETYSVHSHPKLMVDLINEHPEVSSGLEVAHLDVLKGAIHSHMGRWNVNAYDPIVLPVPSTSIERFVHICDYIASRKRITVKLL